MGWTVGLTPLPSYRWGNNSHIYVIAGWVGPKVCLDVLGENNFLSLPGFEPGIVVSVVTTISQQLIIIIIIINKKGVTLQVKGARIN
jgi:hypothetical protein